MELQTLLETKVIIIIIFVGHNCIVEVYYKLCIVQKIHWCARGKGRRAYANEVYSYSNKDYKRKSAFNIWLLKNKKDMQLHASLLTYNFYLKCN
jgi:hypothetical protein